MEHTIYLAAKAFIDKVKPQPLKNKKLVQPLWRMQMMTMMTRSQTGTNSMSFQIMKR